MSDTLIKLQQALKERKNHPPEKSYVSSLYAKGQDKILEKIGEEATELIIASKNNDKNEIIYETADLWFHCLILLEQSNINHTEILNELDRRFGISGIDEKQSRK